MPYDSDYREQTIAALETATPLVEQGADSPGPFDVPADAKRITEILISAVPAWTVDSILGFSSSINFRGSGITIGEGWFLGPSGSTGGAAATTPGGQWEKPMRYLTNIPVKGGGTFSIDGFLLGEDIGALHMLVNIVYDGPVVGKIVDMDQRNIDLTTANALVSLTERGAAVVEGDIKPAYRTIGEVYVGCGGKITASNAAVGTAFHLSGPGLLHAGNYKFIGPGISINDDTAISLTGGLVNPLRYVCGIQTKPNNAIRIQGQMIEGDIGTAFSVAGFAYY